MSLSFTNIVAMLLMLVIGMALGALMFRNTPNTANTVDMEVTSVAADRPPVATASVSSPAAAPPRRGPLRRRDFRAAIRGHRRAV